MIVIGTEATSTPATPSSRALSLAHSAEGPLARIPLPQRSAGLRAVATALREHDQELVGLADTETSLGSARLAGELVRTTFQLDEFAALVDSGGTERLIIDRADAQWPPAPRPDIRRRLIPIGVVAMFAASNFPFAFSVAGGDTASALAAGCPVIVKAHSGHPRLSRRVAEIAQRALDSVGLPDGSLTLVEGRDAGTSLVLDDRVDAIAFTGSTHGGRALFDLASGRPRPIPFYGELGSVNPVFVTEGAAVTDGARIWRELAASFTMGAGQFCTKPGIVFAPRSAGAPAAVATHLGGDLSWHMLDARIAAGFSQRIDEMTARPDIETVVAGRTDGIVSTPTLLRTGIDDFLHDPRGLGEESFGPTTLIVEYDDQGQLLSAARSFVGELTATVQGVPEEAVLTELIQALESRAGRLIWNQWPTGVSVTAAMQHGGPYPASTSARDTSVGAAAIERFQRPVAYQNFPDALLPAALRG